MPLPVTPRSHKASPDELPIASHCSCDLALWRLSVDAIQPVVIGTHDLALTLEDLFLPSAGSGSLFKLIFILGCCCPVFNRIQTSRMTCEQCAVWRVVTAPNYSSFLGYKSKKATVHL